MSGAHLASRPRAQAMLAAAKAGRIDVVLAEALDRLSRDQEDIAGIHKRLTFAGARIVTLSEGEVGSLHVGLKGTMNAMFLEDLARKIRRGQTGNIDRGVSAGGLAYGYDVVRQLDAKGEPVKGLRAINQEQAAVIRRIFAEYAAGRSARTIAHGLNRDGIPSPTGDVWRQPTISGNRARGSGILWNEAYRGALVFGRVRMVKDPDTGRRISRPNPREAWQIVEAPELRIVDDDTWAAVQARKAEAGDALAGKTRRRGGAKHLLTGLVRCGVCGSNFVVNYGGRMRCSGRREAGTCSNDRTAVLADATARALDGIQRHLLAPKAMARFVKVYQAERQRLAAERARTETHSRSRLAEVEAGIENVVTAIVRGVASEAMQRALMGLEAEAKALRARLAEVDAGNVVNLHPAAIDEYRRSVGRLVDVLRDPAAPVEEARAIVGRVIDHIAVHPLEGRGRYELRAMTRLEALLPVNRGGVSVYASGSGGALPPRYTLVPLAC
jgi:DNA invertase Pin-like site-specific DNA recombinase